ncbi:MAG: spore coat protein CotH [Ruminococcus sp.]|nr:spore coat protein CotH [Ruminococcus sp.]
MKKLAAAFAVGLALIGFAGCNSGGGSESSQKLIPEESKTQAQSAPSIDVPSPAEPAADVNCMPIVNIQTKDGGSDAMDFVTKPVKRLVSEKIATWTPNYVMPPEPYYTECSVSLTDVDDKLLIDAADAKVKVRGNWTTSYNKKPLRIKFEKKQSMAGLNDGGEYKNWLLLSEYKDFSMLRNRTAFQLAGEILGGDGYYAADSRLVEVYINGEYWGVYLLTEQQEINDGRVEITEAEKDYAGTDIGYFLEYDGYYYDEEPLQSFKVNYRNDAELVPYDGNGGSGRKASPSAGGMNDVGITIKSDIYSQEQHDFIANYVSNVYDIMYEAAYNNKAFVMSDDFKTISETTALTPKEAVEKVVDVRSLVDSYIIAELTCDADIYWSSFCMSADFGAGGSQKLRFEAPWDFDSALGNKDRCSDGSGFFAANIMFDVNGEFEVMCNPWLMVLMNQDWYQELVKERWTEIYNSGAFDRAYETIASETERLEPAFTRNYDRWDNIRNNGARNELSYAAGACSTQKQAADYLKSWLESRVDFLDSQWHK